MAFAKDTTDESNLKSLERPRRKYYCHQPFLLTDLVLMLGISIDQSSLLALEQTTVEKWRYRYHSHGEWRTWELIVEVFSILAWMAPWVTNKMWNLSGPVSNHPGSHKNDFIRRLSGALPLQRVLTGQRRRSVDWPWDYRWRLPSMVDMKAELNRGLYSVTDTITKKNWNTGHHDRTSSSSPKAFRYKQSEIRE